jgi:hypothetical protein
MSQPDWRNHLFDIQKTGDIITYCWGNRTKASGAPKCFATNESGQRARAAYTIQQALSNPYTAFGKRRLKAWEKRQVERSARNEANKLKK